MKRILTFLAIMMLPLSLWAMTPVSDSDLSNVTGQAGVSINPDLTMDLYIGTMAWGDADGLKGAENPWTVVSTGGYIGVTGFDITNLMIRLRGTSDGYNGYDATTDLKPITIDVANGNKLSYGATTFVRFGLGALQISMDELQFNVSLGSHAATFGTAPTLNQTLGVVTLGAMDVYINPGSYVDIYAHPGSGVNFGLNMTIDAINLPYVSWGDTDGVPGGIVGSGTTWGTSNGDGYVGLADFRIGDGSSAAITIMGTVAIDVVTANHGTYADLQFLFDHLPHYTNQADVIDALLVDFDAGLDAAFGTGTHTAAQLQALLTNPIYSGIGLQSLQGIITALMHSAAYYAAVTPISVVHISFPEDLTINVAKMVGKVVVADNAQLYYDALTGFPATTTPNSELGYMYIKSMGVTIDSSSWVDIWAH